MGDAPRSKGNADEINAANDWVTNDRETTSGAAARLGKLGGRARALTLTADERAEIARLAAKVRWRKD